MPRVPTTNDEKDDSGLQMKARKLDTLRAYPPLAPVYEPSKIISSKPKVKVTKKAKKTEWEEKCRISFTKSDILMLTILHDPFSKPMAVTPMILAPETIVFTYYIPKKKPISATKKLFKTLAFSKISKEIESLDINLQLDPATADLLIPYANPSNLFILTIITKHKKGFQIKSHFVDSIATTKKRYY